MWKLRYVYKHKDCLYTDKVQEFKLLFYGYPINNYVKGDFIYISALHVLEGERKNIQKYYSYLKSITYKIEPVSSNAFFTLTKVSKNKEYYRLMYNPYVFYSAPIVHKQGKEFVELSSWDKKPLADILLFLRKNRNTEMFKLLSFRQEKHSNVFMIKNIGRLTDKQREIFELAKNLGYYNYPRKANLDYIAKIARVSKSTVHENLRRAESNIMKQI